MFFGKSCEKILKYCNKVGYWKTNHSQLYLGAILSYEAHSSLRLLWDLRKWNSCYHLVCGILLVFAGCCAVSEFLWAKNNIFPLLTSQMYLFLRDRISWLASKREEAWYSELSKSGRHNIAEVLGWKWFEAMIFLPIISSHCGGINIVHHNSDCSSVSKQNWKG